MLWNRRFYGIVMYSIKSKYFAIFLLSLSACGGSDGTSSEVLEIPPEVERGALPADPTIARNEQGRSFVAYYADGAATPTGEGISENLVKPYLNGKLDVFSGTVSYFLDEQDETIAYVANENADGSINSSKYVFDGKDADGLDIYLEEEGSGRLEVRRHPTGWIWGRVFGKTGAGFDLRGNFATGWPVARDTLTPLGTATYNTFRSADLYLSDGRTLFGGDVDLTANFNTNTVSGVVFRRIGPVGDFQRLSAEVTVTNGRIASDGSVTMEGNNLTFTQFEDLTDQVPYLDSVPPSSIVKYSGTTNVTESKLNGQFVGDLDSSTIVGNYSGRVTVGVEGGGSEQLDFSGIFRAEN